MAMKLSPFITPKTLLIMKTPSIHVCQQNLFDIEPVSKNPKPKCESSYIFDIVDALSAPILTFSPLWSDTIPKRMLQIVPLTRMKALMKQEQLATYAECVIYIYTRTLEAPMDSEWTNIYTHVSCKTLEEWFNEDHWKSTIAPKVLSDWLLSKLNGLRQHIYNKRREILKGRLRSQDHTEKDMLEKETKSKEPSAQQQSILYFD